MTEKREKLIARFQRWLDTDPRPNITAAECANIAEQYAKDELELFAIPVVSVHVCPECGAEMYLGLRKVLYICLNEFCNYNEKAN